MSDVLNVELLTNEKYGNKSISLRYLRDFRELAIGFIKDWNFS